jgi:hypothetical protein
LHFTKKLDLNLQELEKMKCVECDVAVKKKDGWWQCDDFRHCEYYLCEKHGPVFKTDYREPKPKNANPDYFALNTVQAKCEDNQLLVYKKHLQQETSGS